MESNKQGGYQSKDTVELQSDLDNDEEYEQRKGIASYFQKMFRKKKKWKLIIKLPNNNNYYILKV